MKMMPITSEQYLSNQLSKDQEIITLEEILRKPENQTQDDNDFTLNEARQYTYATDM